MNENAMMKKTGRGMAKADMQEMFGKKKPAAKKAAAKKAPAKKMGMGGKAYAAGGMTKMGAVKTNSRPDGIIEQGGTKGKMVAMKMGGKSC
jgi:hypothetical protein